MMDNIGGMNKHRKAWHEYQTRGYILFDVRLDRVGIVGRLTTDARLDTSHQWSFFPSLALSFVVGTKAHSPSSNAQSIP